MISINLWNFHISFDFVKQYLIFLYVSSNTFNDSGRLKRSSRVAIRNLEACTETHFSPICYPLAPSVFFLKYKWSFHFLNKTMSWLSFTMKINSNILNRIFSDCQVLPFIYVLRLTYPLFPNTFMLWLAHLHLYV